MALKSNDVAAMQETLPLFTDHAEMVADIFYRRLFEIDPSLRQMFSSNMVEQGAKLTATLAVAVNSLARWDKIAPVLAELAKRHVTYGVQPQHYSTVGQALLETLKKGGAKPHQIEAWDRGLGVISTAMIQSAYTASSKS